MRKIFYICRSLVQKFLQIFVWKRHSHFCQIWSNSAWWKSATLELFSCMFEWHCIITQLFCNDIIFGEVKSLVICVKHNGPNTDNVNVNIDGIEKSLSTNINDTQTKFLLEYWKNWQHLYSGNPFIVEKCLHNGRNSWSRQYLRNALNMTQVIINQCH